MISTIFDKFTLFLLIFSRMSGAILLNPLLGRKNVPGIVKAGMTLVTAIALTLSDTNAALNKTSVFDVIFRMVFEFAIGYAISLIMGMFLSSIIVASETIDVQLGIGMARVFDPGNSTSTPVTGSFYNAFLLILFFASNAHITLFKLFADTLKAIPAGTTLDFSKAAHAVVGIFGSTLTLALKFAMPIIAIEFITEIGLGVLTRAVPGVNIFSVGIQLKLLAGLLVIFLLTPLFGYYCDSLYNSMFTGITEILKSV
jgi:flagellar biosynthetic protein FliR